MDLYSPLYIFITPISNVQQYFNPVSTMKTKLPNKGVLEFWCGLCLGLVYTLCKDCRDAYLLFQTKKNCYLTVY